MSRLIDLDKLKDHIDDDCAYKTIQADDMVNRQKALDLIDNIKKEHELHETLVEQLEELSVQYNLLCEVEQKPKDKKKEKNVILFRQRNVG